VGFREREERDAREKEYPPRSLGWGRHCRFGLCGIIVIVLVGDINRGFIESG